jgi:hypothetical protein
LFRVSDLVLSASRCEILSRIEYRVPCHGDFLKISPLFSIAVRIILNEMNVEWRIENEQDGPLNIQYRMSNIQCRSKKRIFAV